MHGEGYSNYYNAEQGYYNFPGGYGGGPAPHGAILDAEEKGALLTLTVQWYDYYDLPLFRHRTVIERRDAPEDFRYLSNEVLEDFTRSD